MERGVRLTAAPWVGLAVLAGIGSVLALGLPSTALDWQPAMAFTEPWRWWSGALVHWSTQHLLSNLAGAVVLAALGAVARLPVLAACAWFAAWPLTQLGLLLLPALLHYGGLSGVLHAGVAVAAVWLLADGTRRQRRVAAAMAFGLVLKILLEAPWGAPLRHHAHWDIAIAPLAHATGAVAGVLCAAPLATVQVWRRHRRRVSGKA